VTFRSGRSSSISSSFAIPNHNVNRVSSYETGAEGDPEDCPPEYTRKPDPPDTSKCGPMKYKTKEKTFSLAIVGGRLGPFGAIDDRYDAKCPDETSWSVVSKGALSRQRKDIHKAITNKAVRSIELSSSKKSSTDFTEPDLTAKDMFLVGDQATVTGAGFASYKWSVKLTRVR
jgi:hypothetical protein